jgi:hypothetical protein
MADQVFVATLKNGKKYKFTVPEGKELTPDQLFGTVVESFPEDFKADIKEYQSKYLKNTDTGIPAQRAREYWASKDKENFDFKNLSPIGIGAIKQYAKSAAITREAEKKIKPLDIQAYRQEYLDPDARSPEAMPARVLQQYRLSPNRATFQFPKGFSEVGRAAIRRVVAEEDEQRRVANVELDRQLAAERREPPMTVGEFGVTPTEARKVMRTLDTRATMLRTGQRASEAPPLGLDPYGASAPGRGVGETIRRDLAQLGIPSNVMVGGAMAVPLAAGGATLASVPLIGGPLAALGGISAGLVPAVESAGRGSVTGDYREAVGSAITGIGGEALLGTTLLGSRGMQAMRGTLTNRLTQRAAQIAEMEGRLAPPAPTAPVVRRRQLSPPPDQGIPEGPRVLPERPAIIPAEGPEVVPQPMVTPPVRPSAPVEPPRRGLYPMPEETRTSPYRRRPLLTTPLDAPVARGPEVVDFEPPAITVPDATGTPPLGAATAPFTAEELATRRVMTRGVDTLQENLRILLGRRDAQVRQYGSVAPDLDDAIITLVNRIEMQGGTVPFEFRTGLPGRRQQKKRVDEIAPEPTPEPEAPDAVASAPRPVAEPVSPEPAPVPETVVSPPDVPTPGPVPESPVSPEVAPTAVPRTPDVDQIDQIESELNRALGIRQAAQRQEAINLGVVESIPLQGSTSAVSRADIERVVTDPEYRAEMMSRLDNIDWEDANSYKGLSTAEQTAAWIRQRELTPQLNSPVEAVRRGALQEWIKLHQAIYKIGSQKGFELAMQRLFNSVIDFSNPDVSNDIRSFIASTMRNAGATDDQIELAINKVLPRANQGILENSNAQRRVNDAAEVASQVIADAKRRGRRPTDDDILQEYRRRLGEIDKTQAERWGQKSVYVAPVVREFRNGVRRLEQVKARIKELYGEELSDDVLNDIMREARIEFQLDRNKIDQVVQGINTSVRREVWNTYSGSKRTLQRLKNFQNFERMIVLGLDLGIFGVQFGLAQASRPTFLASDLPQTATRTGAERVLSSTLGGVPTRKGGTIGATLRSFKSERGAAEANEAIDTLARVRYSEFDDPFGEAGLMGFRQQDRDLGGLSGEVSYDTAAALEDLRKIPGVGRLTGKLYESSQRATETGLRYGRALLFDQMMAPFENLKGEQKMQAMQSVASFVNSVTGGGTYSQSVESGLRLLGNVQTAPRYYMSNLEFASGIAPFVRTLQKSQGLPPKEVAKLSKMVAMEYGRLATMMTVAKMLLEPYGAEVVADPFDPDFGTVRYSLTEGAEGTFSLLAGREKYVPLILSMSGFKRERPAAGVSPQWRRLTVGDRAQAVANTLYGKSTFIPRTAASLIPAKLPEEARFLGPSADILARSEFRAPGGTTFVPAETLNAPGATLMYFGQMVPVALFAKQIAQNIPLYMGNGSTEQGKKVIERARFGGSLASIAGFGSNIKLKPEMVQYVMSDKSIAALPPAVRERIRLNIFSGKPVSPADQKALSAALGGR